MLNHRRILKYSKKDTFSVPVFVYLLTVTVNYKDIQKQIIWKNKEK